MTVSFEHHDVVSVGASINLIGDLAVTFSIEYRQKDQPPEKGNHVLSLYMPASETEGVLALVEAINGVAKKYGINIDPKLCKGSLHHETKHP